MGAPKFYDPSSFGGCLAPPTAACYSCNGPLHKNNKPIMATYFTVSGAIPVKKVELRCRSCNVNYGITKYGSSESGYEYRIKIILCHIIITQLNVN